MNNKAYLLILGCIAITFITFPLILEAAPPNLLLNPSFEDNTGSGRVATSWTSQNLTLTDTWGKQTLTAQAPPSADKVRVIFGSTGINLTGKFDDAELTGTSTFYVRPDGNDANSGLENTPQGAWATIQKAADTLKSGDIAEIQAGTYNEAVTITNSGSSEQYIVFRANEEVIIDAKGPSIKLDGANYIRLEGITCKSTTSSGISLVSSNNNILVRNISTGKGIETDSNSTDNQLIGNIASQDSSSQGSSSTLISTIAGASPVSTSFLVPVAAGSISGKVTLQSRTNHQGLITFRLAIPGESNPFTTYEVNTTSDGSYTLTDVPAGIYNLSAKHQIFLRQNQVLIEVTEGQTTSNVNFSLLGGDANNDNSVATGDMVLVRNAWLSKEGDPNWDPRADFNGDGSVATGDLVILRMNWLKNGLEPQINITSPENNTFTNTSSITVSGTVSYSTATVTVNNLPAQVTGNTFTASNIPLTQGTNIITARATKDTETATDTINVILDTDPPSINIYTPDANATTRSNIVYGRVSDDTQTVTVNGTPAELLSDFRFIARPTLSEGANTITVQAQDQATNTNQASVNITYNMQTPKVTITSPLDNSTQNISPINVQGTNTEDPSFIMVNSATALIDVTNFTAEGVTLDSTKTVITATGYDATNNKFCDSIVVNSPSLANYELIKISGDATEDDPERPSAGSNQILKVRVEKNSLVAPNEQVQFNITQGNGTLSSQSSFTDINGEAQVTLTTDTNSDITNQVECYPTSNPLVKDTFYVDTKPAAPSTLTKITDESVTPVPGAIIPLIVKLTDSNNNPIQNETVNFQVISGDSTLSSPTAVTTYYGEAKVDLTCPNLGLVLTQIQASSSTVPSVTATFNITTSAPLTITVQDIIDKVNYNDAKIQDIKADISVTSDADFLPPTMQLKIWQKGNKQKVEEICPEHNITIRPPLEISSEYTGMHKELISCNPDSNTYAIKTKPEGQTESYPYRVIYVDYNKGVEIKTEYYTNENDIAMIYTYEVGDLMLIGDIWIYRKLLEITYEGESRKELYCTEYIYSNIEINSGIPDSEFE